MSRFSLPTAYLILFVAVAGCGKSSSEPNSDAKSSTPVKSGNDVAGKKSPGGEVPKPTPAISRPAVADAIDTTYISSNFVAAAVVHPRRIYESQTVQDLLKVLETTLGKQEFDKGMAELKSKLGFDPKSLEQAVALADMNLINEGLQMGPRRRRGFGKKTGYEKTESFNRFEKTRGFREEIEKTPKRGSSTPDSKKKAFRGAKTEAPDGCDLTVEFQPQFPGEPGREKDPSPAVILRLSAPIDQKAFLETVTPTHVEFGPMGRKETKEKLTTQVVAGHTVHSTSVGPSFAFLDGGKTVLVGSRLNLSRMFDAKAADSPLIRRLKSISKNHDYIAAIAGEPVQQALIEVRKNVPVDELPGPFRPLPDLLVGSKSLAMTVNITKDPMLSLILESGDEKSASGLVDVINKTGLPMLKAQYDRMKSKESSNPEAAPYFKIADELIAGLSVKSEKTDVVLELKRPASMNEFPLLLVKAVQQARESARQATRKNNLKQIGLAMHNYHDTFGHFPANDSMGSSNNPKQKSGLSWRVHLLPQLEQSHLYQQFKLDEPWDSDHNKKLISKMPAVFASLEHPELQKDGKTSLHVFVDSKNPTTPFSAKDLKGQFRGSRFRDIVDGTSNTFMVVEAGVDKADIWTKPGGLPFDPAKDPKEILGKIEGKSFLALFCDGYVRSMSKDIKGDVLKLLIQHSDGTPVDPDDPDRKFPEFKRGPRKEPDAAKSKAP